METVFFSFIYEFPCISHLQFQIDPVTCTPFWVHKYFESDAFVLHLFQLYLQKMNDIFVWWFQELVDTLITCIKKDVGFSEGKPVAALTIYKCLLNWKSFEAERTNVFDMLIHIIGSALEVMFNSTFFLRIRTYLSWAHISIFKVFFLYDFRDTFIFRRNKCFSTLIFRGVSMTRNLWETYRIWRLRFDAVIVFLQIMSRKSWYLDIFLVLLILVWCPEVSKSILSPYSATNVVENLQYNCLIPICQFPVTNIFISWHLICSNGSFCFRMRQTMIVWLTGFATHLHYFFYSNEPLNLHLHLNLLRPPRFSEGWLKYDYPLSCW